MARRIVGNLDFEGELARAAAGTRREREERAPRSSDPRFALPREVLSSASAFATLLRALAVEGDRLWTPTGVGASRLPPVPGLPIPVLEAGPLSRLEPTAELLAWGESPAVERLRRRSQGEPRSSTERHLEAASRIRCPSASAPDDRPRPLGDLLWSAPAPAADAAIRANHRGFCFEVASSLGIALPGAAVVGSVREIQDAISGGGASAAPGERWVLKAPFSAAGRLRLRGQGRKLSASELRRAERLLSLFGTLLFEPWMERLGDFGTCGIVLGDRVRLWPPHRSDVDSAGVFRGIALGGALDWSASERDRAEETALAVGRRLLAVGYRGPFTVDSWRYRDAGGAQRFQPLGEINARMTFGLVAQAVVERLAVAGRMEGRASVRLRLKTGKEEVEAALGRGADVVPLLLPGLDGSASAWIEVVATP